MNRLTFLISITAVVVGCNSGGAQSGAPCSHADQCASELCLQSNDGGMCATRCGASATSGNGDCPTGQVCGRFDYRNIDPDSGMYSGPESEVLMVCRPPLTTVCSSVVPCAAGQVCTGDPGVCSTSCTMDDQCLTGLCLPASGTQACGAPGTCSPLCDDVAECPSLWYCDLIGADTIGHGRCEPIDGYDASVVPPDACGTPDF